MPRNQAGPRRAGPHARAIVILRTSGQTHFGRTRLGMVRLLIPTGSPPTMLNTCKVFSTAVVLASIAAAEASPPSHASERPLADRQGPVRVEQLSAPDLVLRID